MWSGQSERKSAAGAAVHLRESWAKPQFTRYAVATLDFNERIVGGKSLNQARLRRRLPDWINSPPQ
jgi:hypothetical protein